MLVNNCSKEQNRTINQSIEWLGKNAPNPTIRAISTRPKNRNPMTIANARSVVNSKISQVYYAYVITYRSKRRAKVSGV
ncbi:MAG: hypothetical protein ABSB40_00440 [Nitrososphaeria archaeon]